MGSVKTCQTKKGETERTRWDMGGNQPQNRQHRRNQPLVEFTDNPQSIHANQEPYCIDGQKGVGEGGWQIGKKGQGGTRKKGNEKRPKKQDGTKPKTRSSDKQTTLRTGPVKK